MEGKKLDPYLTPKRKDLNVKIKTSRESEKTQVNIYLIVGKTRHSIKAVNRRNQYTTVHKNHVAVRRGGLVWK